jgi:hypothetical protein
MHGHRVSQQQVACAGSRRPAGRPRGLAGQRRAALRRASSTEQPHLEAGCSWPGSVNETQAEPRDQPPFMGRRACGRCSVSAEAISWALNPEQGTLRFIRPVHARLCRSVTSVQRRGPHLSASDRDSPLPLRSQNRTPGRRSWPAAATSEPAGAKTPTAPTPDAAEPATRLPPRTTWASALNQSCGANHFADGSSAPSVWPTTT